VQTGQYLFVSHHTQQLLGYAPAVFKERGFELMQELLHPADAGSYWQLMLQVWQFLITLPPEQRLHYQFNCDYRLRKTDGSYVRLLEQNIILATDQRHVITHLLGTCTDITQWKKSEGLTATIIPITNHAAQLWEPAFLSATCPLTQREQEILKLLAAGFSSKLIADRLCLSCHTVNTHRRNMIVKTNAKNTGELIQFALKRQYI
jgi:DNA-binding CsgD family transcriptional regulator